MWTTMGEPFSRTRRLGEVNNTWSLLSLVDLQETFLRAQTTREK